MGRALCLSLALLFLANVIPSKAQKAEAAAAAETRVTVAAGAPLALECRLRPEQRAEWRRDGGALPADVRVEPELPAPDGRLAARLRAPAARAAHAGLYTCSRERDQRVRLLVQPAPAPAPAPAAGEPATEAAAAAAAGAGAAAAGAGAGAEAEADAEEVVYDVRGPLTLNCTLPNPGKLEYVWRKNGTLLEEVWELQGRHSLVRARAALELPHALEDDFGNYSCALPPAAEQRWAVRGRPHLKLPANTNVVEGQKLKLVCKVIGKPYPEVEWWYSNGTGEQWVEALAALGARATLAGSEQGVPGGALVVEAAARADAGLYNCSAARAQPASTRLRVKDMYAALWPFLGICAEVFVLCAIILVYEKRRTKPELDDSDTDNHDQKKS